MEKPSKKLDPVVMIGQTLSKTTGDSGSQVIGINCGPFGMVKVYSAVKEKGADINGFYCEYVRVTIEHLTEDEARNEYVEKGGCWKEEKS